MRIQKIQKLIYFVLLMLSPLCLFRCSLGTFSRPDFVTLRFQFEGGTKQYIHSVNLSFFQRPLDSVNPPASINNFNCLALNIVGPGIASSGSSENIESTLSGLRQGGFCAYTGVTSQTIPLGTEVDVEMLVPSGPSRFIQVLGIVDPDGKYCGSSLPFSFINNSNSSNSRSVYVLGMVQRDLFKSESITINNSYDGLTDELKLQRYFYCNDNQSASPSPSPSPVASGVPPVVTSVFPEAGSTTFAKTITISGTGFLVGTTPSVVIGNSSCTSVTVVSTTQITCVYPVSSSTGTVNIQVINPDGNSGTLINGFTYLPGANLRFWLKAEEGVTAGVSGLTNWADMSSGVGFSVTTQSVSGLPDPQARPTGGPNSRAAIEFGGSPGGSGAHMQSSLINFNAGTAMAGLTLFFVGKKSNGGDFMGVANDVPVGSTASLPYLYLGSSSDNFIFDAFNKTPPNDNRMSTTTGFAVGNANLTDFRIHTILWNKDDPFNGQRLSYTVGNNAPVYADDNQIYEFYLTNKYITIGNASSNALAGFISEVMIYSRTLTSAEVTTVKTYLQSKYGL